MKLKKDVLYISFHKPKGLVGHLISFFVSEEIITRVFPLELKKFMLILFQGTM